MNKEEHARLMLEKITEIEDLKSELKKKDKIIDLMADRLVGTTHGMDIFCSVEDVKEYFERKVENGN